MSGTGSDISPDAARALIERIDGLDRVAEALAGERAYLVGGAVRDALLGLPRADLDIVVEGDALKAARRVDPDARGHGRFGTALARVDGLEVDIASARAETYERPGALPEVRGAGIDED